jgi:hypothetical protein
MQKHGNFTSLIQYILFENKNFINSIYFIDFFQMKIGCRTIVAVQEVCTRSISFGEVDSMASIFQIRDTVSLYNSLLTLEVAFCSQIF